MCWREPEIISNSTVSGNCGFHFTTWLESFIRNHRETQWGWDLLRIKNIGVFVLHISLVIFLETHLAIRASDMKQVVNKCLCFSFSQIYMIIGITCFMGSVIISMWISFTAVFLKAWMLESLHQKEMALHNIVAKTMDRTKKPGFKSQPCHLLALCQWVKNSASISIIKYRWQNVVFCNFKEVNTYKILITRAPGWLSQVSV